MDEQRPDTLAGFPAVEHAGGIERCGVCSAVDTATNHPTPNPFAGGDEVGVLPWMEAPTKSARGHRQSVLVGVLDGESVEVYGQTNHVGWLEPDLDPVVWQVGGQRLDRPGSEQQAPVARTPGNDLEPSIRLEDQHGPSISPCIGALSVTGAERAGHGQTQHSSTSPSLDAGVHAHICSISIA